MREVIVVLLETAGNQSFIFATNKLREVVGASELIHRTGTSWLVEAVCGIANRTIPDQADPGWLRRFLRDTASNPPIEDQTDPATAVEIVVAASGKAILLTRDRGVGERIVGTVTRRALREAPGLTVRGAISGPFDWAASGELHAHITKAHHRHAALSGHVPGPEARFPRLPVVRSCETSGGPAHLLFIPRDAGGPSGREMPLSLGTQVKGGYLGPKEHRVAAGALARIKRAVPSESQPLLFPSIEALEQALGQQTAVAADTGEAAIGDADTGTADTGTARDGGPDAEDARANPADERSETGEGQGWLGVIHADGNGLGSIFLDFQSCLAAAGLPTDSRACAATLRDFSLALDLCTAKAFAAALATTAAQVGTDRGPGRKPGLVPLVLGGDDLTVLATGDAALAFTVAYLDAFQRITSRPLDADVWTGGNRDIIQVLAGARFGVGRLSAAAGVALVKAHHPFHAAYALSEDLCQSAKRTKKWADQPDKGPWPVSSLDFHVLYDSTTGALSTIRDRLLTVPGRTAGMTARLIARPYVLDWPEGASPPKALAAAAAARRWRDLESLLLAMEDAAADDRGARSLLHQLRAALHRGEAAAEAQFSLVRARLQSERTGRRLLRALAGAGGDTLFFPLNDHPGGEGPRGCRLLDALDVRAFWPAGAPQSEDMVEAEHG